MGYRGGQPTAPVATTTWLDAHNSDMSSICTCDKRFSARFLRIDFGAQSRRPAIGHFLEVLTYGGADLRQVPVISGSAQNLF